MPIELWLAFAAASAAFLAVPMGPTVMVVVGYALGQGRKTGWATVPGVTLGDFTAMTISLLGAGAVLAASATLFTLLKLVGAAYLIWLGIRLWRAEPSAEVLAGKARGRGAMFWNAYAVTALNPQSIMFFIAFVPQFVAADRPLLPQFAILEGTFLALAALNVTLWAALAGTLHARLRRPAILRLFNRVGGSVLIGSGLLSATARQGG